MTTFGFPVRVDRRGRTAGADLDTHIRELIEQVLFTSPGERVNRPDFGSGVMQLVFAPNSPELASAVQFTVQGALQRYLGEQVLVEDVNASSEDSRLQVTVKYQVRRDNQRRTAAFTFEA